MINRMMIASCAALVLAIPTFAQAPAGVPADPPAGLVERPMADLAPSGGEGFTSPAGDRFWVSGEYLFGWIQGTKLPPLVSTSPPGTPRAAAGVLGSPTTTVLFEGTVNDESRAGFRFGGGYWFGPQRFIGIEAGFMMLESQSSFFGAASDGSTILARPYLDANTSTPASVLIAFPGTTGSSGALQIRASSGNFYEGHIDITENAIDESWVRVNPLIGYRFYRYDEGLGIGQTIFPSDPSFVPGTQITAGDDFTTHNEFHGCDMGVRAQFFWQNLSVGFLGKLAVGKMRNQVNINGGQATIVPGLDPVTQVGGVLALSSNIGVHRSDEWSLLPELGINFGWQVNRNVRLIGGYTVLFLQDVARAANQIDPVVNPNLFPPVTQPVVGPNSPAFTMNLQDIWLQSLSMGVQYSY